jgi:N-methylhydantoinase B
MTTIDTSTDRRLKDLSDEEFIERYQCDRFTASVLSSRFRYIVKHMCTHLVTNAFSVILRDWYDFSAILSGPPDLDYPMSAVSDSLMIFSGSMSEGVRNSVNEFGVENLRPGDVLVCNDPIRVGTHPNDVCFTRPIFHGERIVGFVVLQPHMMDVGGIVPAGFSANKHNIYENGLVIPPTLFWRDDKPVKSAFSLLFDNARFGEVMLPDMMSIFADLKLGERLVLEWIERYGLDAYLGAVRYATDVTADSMRDAIREMPDGVYEGEDMLDCDGVDASEEYTIRTKVKIAGSRIEVDLSGSSRQARTCINCGWLDVKTSVATCLKFLLEPHEPFTSGAFRHVDIVLPAGSVASALPPDGAIMLYWEAASAVFLAILRALANALGPRAIAGDFGSAMVHNANGLRADGSPWASSAVCGGEIGPWGATGDGDGENSLAIYLANSIAPPVESTEQDAPLVLLRREVTIDSGGAGHNRGGAATTKDTLWLGECDQYSYALHVKKASGAGVYGGTDGKPGGIWIWPGGPEAKADFVGFDPDSMLRAEPICGLLDPGTHRLDHEQGTYYHFGRQPYWRTAPNAITRYQTNAGGGWGDPLSRDPERVLRDVRNEYVSREAARTQYGVVIVGGDPDTDPEAMAVDSEATAKLRSELGAGRA